MHRKKLNKVSSAILNVSKSPRFWKISRSKRIVPSSSLFQILYFVVPRSAGAVKIKSFSASPSMFGGRLIESWTRLIAGFFIISSAGAGLMSCLEMGFGGVGACSGAGDSATTGTAAFRAV
jgi:hypothetical protein